MRPLSTTEIRSSFRNCSRGEASRVSMPDLELTPWSDLDFLGWQDPDGSRRAYLVVDRSNPADAQDEDQGTPELVGLVLSQTQPGSRGAARATMCQLCLTPHGSQGVCLTVARKAGTAGRKGDSSGIYICRDLACSLYLRGKRVSGSPRLRETLDEGQTTARCRRNLDDFVNRVLGSGV